MNLSVIVPLYNEARTLEELVGRVSATGLAAEILLVDDASTDGSGEIADQLAAVHDEVRVFHHPKNQGKGAAVRTGMDAFTGDVVLIQDADLEYDPADYAALLFPIHDGKADVVYGSRFLGGAYSRVHLYWHYVGNRCLTTLSNIFTNLNLTDMETCYKVMTRDVAGRLDLRSRTFAVEAEMTQKIGRLGVRIYEVPIRYAGRDYSEGKKIRAKDAWIAIWAIVRWGLFG